MYLGEMTAKIVIADKYTLNGLHNVEIKKSVHQPLQTAKLELPLSVVIRNNDSVEYIKLSDKIKEGDSISIAFGYDGKNNVEFTGYIRRINYAQPLVLECEDELYLLRKLKLKKGFGKTTIKDLMTWLLSEMNKVQNIDWVLYDKMPEFVFSKYLIGMDGITANGIDIITDLTNNYPFSIRLIDLNGKKTLYVGLTYGLILSDVKYVFNRNTISTSELKYYSSTDPKRYKIKIVAYKLDGTNITYEYGDKGGEEIEKKVIGNYTEAELKQMALFELANYSGNGYKGKFTTFLFPYCEPGNIAVLADPQFTDRGGRHYIGTVTTIFGTGGGKREPEIDHIIL